MQCPALIDERAFPSYASTIKMTEKKTQHISLILFCFVFSQHVTWGFHWGVKAALKADGR